MGLVTKKAKSCRCLLAAMLAAVAAPHLTSARAEPAPSSHWAWSDLLRPLAPSIRRAEWARNEVDAFILARLEREGLDPAPDASREALIRRATYDLTGLPPTPQEIDAFVHDDAPDAWERAVDRLLASPAYGERWGRHWLDLARYADSNGFEFDEPRPDAWRYRDYVIRSLNADKPFDRFVEEQIAGDELFPGDLDALVATGFNLLGPDMTDSSDSAQRRYNTLCDMTDAAGFVFLGVTIACARCHDHKFDPFTREDYYRLQAFFAPTAFRNDLVVATEAQLSQFRKDEGAYSLLVAPTEAAVRALEAPYRERLREEKLSKIADAARAAHRVPEDRRTAEERALVESTARLIAVSNDEVLGAMNETDRKRRKELDDETKKLDAKKPRPLPKALGLSNGAGTKTFVLERGDLAQRGDEVDPGFPHVVAPAGADAPAAPRRRADLARWVASPSNPLTTRVIVNRIWQHHFGRAIVPTPNDFGLRGEPPSHPELLDWLATELAKRRFELKAIHRSILVSSAYRQDSTPSPRALEKDPLNRLVSRQNRRRLEGEAVRDALLVTSGELDRRMGGPGVFPEIPAEALKGTNAWKPSPAPADRVRRSIYIFARRNLRFPFLDAFDLPDSNASCPRRETSTTSTQALTLLNADEVQHASHALAHRLEMEAPAGDARIAHLFTLTLGRRPSQAEVEWARDFLAASPLAELCRVFYNVNEFVYVD